MNKLDEIEKRMMGGVAWSGRNAYYETDVSLLIRAVRQLGARVEGLTLSFDSNYVISGVEKRTPIDPDVLDLIQEDTPRS